MKHSIARNLALSLTALLLAEAAAPALADVRAHSRNSVSPPRNSNAARNHNVSRNTNVNRNNNINVNSNRNVNVSVDVDHHGGYCGGRCYHDYHPVATVAAVAVTAAVIGSIVMSLRTGCQTVIVGGLAYQQCGSTWYQPQTGGSTTNYIVVNPPR